ncbi:MAG: aldo/keto reductase [Cyanobacteria bacterium]|nr:aldo/keto reductase [Cyanobacteriota bacterium]
MTALEESDAHTRVALSSISPSVSPFMSLGTVQLGLPYGINNQQGQPSSQESMAILQNAINSGITVWDTARAYGESEERIGEFFRALQIDPSQIIVITKCDPLSQLSPQASTQEVNEAVDNSVNTSSSALGFRCLPVLLLHRWSHFSDWGGQIWQRLKMHQQQGKIEQLGVSVMTPDELQHALREVDISWIQLPFNLLDGRWKTPSILREIETAKRNRPNLKIHGRSALLQGLLCADVSRYRTVCPEWQFASQFLSLRDTWVAKFQRYSIPDLCYAYVRHHQWIDSVVVGVESREQLTDNVALFQQETLTREQVAEIDQQIALLDIPESLVNPSLWKNIEF